MSVSGQGCRAIHYSESLCSHMSMLAEPQMRKKELCSEKHLCSLRECSWKPTPAPTSLCSWSGPSSVLRRFRTCTSCGSPVVPLLAQPDRTVKLSIRAWTGWEALTGDSSHCVPDSGPGDRMIDMSHLERAIKSTPKYLGCSSHCQATRGGFTSKNLLENK
jgi:hypothetical protein